MANYGKLFSRIWTDQDFTSLEAAAQQLYCLLISHSTRNHAGVLPMALRRWARSTAGATASTVRASLATLTERGFVVADWDTEEVLVRTFIRNDEVFKQPQVMRSALKSAETVESETIRWALHDELNRLPEHSESDKANDVAKRLVDGLTRRPIEPCAEAAGSLPEPCAEALGVGGYVSTVGEAPTPTPATAPDNDTAVPAFVETGARPTKRHPSSSAKTVVRQTLGSAGYPQTIQDRLAVQVEKLIHEGHPDTLVRQALTEWDRREDCGKPEFLPTVLGDVVKQSRAAPGNNGRPKHKMRLLAELAQQVQAEEQHGRKELLP